MNAVSQAIVLCPQVSNVSINKKRTVLLSLLLNVKDFSKTSEVSPEFQEMKLEWGMKEEEPEKRVMQPSLLAQTATHTHPGIWRPLVLAA